MNTADLQAKKERGEPIVVLTCYDSPTAAWQKAAGVDVAFCADSVGTNLLGYDDEREVTMDDMIHHLKAVRRGLRGSTYLLADLPYGSCDSAEQALGNSLRFLTLGADGVKLEGYKPEVVDKLCQRGIDVWCHLGLNPQIHEAKRVKARTATAAARLVERALALEAAGARFLVLELIPEEVARIVSERLTIPTIGIAAGRFTDGQVLVVTDMLGVHDFDLRHVTRYADFGRAGAEAIAGYTEDVRQRRFPNADQAWHMKADEAAEFERWLADHPASA
jgi:3-methyl-2-oxobutanoate hydroxymethyltransferase